MHTELTASTRPRPRPLHLLEVVDRLRELKDPLAAPYRVDHALTSRRIDTRSLKPYLRFVKGRYTRNLVYRDPMFEVLVLCWGEGARAPAHDHAGQRCWLLPLAGALHLTDYRILEGGKQPGHARLECVGVRQQVGPGELDRRADDDDVHSVEVAEGADLAVSLHIYARPIDACLVYDVAAQTCQRRELAYTRLPFARIPRAAQRLRHQLHPRTLAIAMSSWWRARRAHALLGT